MRNEFKYCLYTILILGGLLSCTDEDELIEKRESVFQVKGDTTKNDTTATSFKSGGVDFSNYVAIGNSLTAGFMDGALYKSGQLNSMPNLLASSFAKVGGGDFVQPIIDHPNGFNNSFSDTDKGIIKGRTVLDLSIPGPVPTDGDITTLMTPFPGDKLNNLGVPGLRAIEVGSPQVGSPTSGNPHYARIASNPGTSTYLADVAQKAGTFFTVWLGNNDILLYALSGGTGLDGGENPQNDTSRTALVSEFSFKQAYDGVIGTLFTGDKKGVLVTIPPVSIVPFFQAVRYNAIPFDSTKAEDKATVTALNGATAYGGFNAALDGLVTAKVIDQAEADKRKISFGFGNNPIVIIDDNLTSLSAVLSGINPALAIYGQARQMNPGEVVLLSAGAVLGTLADTTNKSSFYGIAVPLDDKFTLTVDELDLINTRTASFNNHIKSKAGDNIAVFDFNSYLLQKIVQEKGFQVDGFKLSPDFTPSGVFSTDGIHPNPRGNGLIANEIIKVVEEKWGAVLPRISVLGLSGVTLKGS